MDGESAAEEFMKAFPDIAHRVVTMDIEESRHHDIHGRLWRKLLLSAAM